MSEYSAAELAAQVNDPDCDHVGPWSVQGLRRRRLSLVDDEDSLGMRAGVGVRVPHRHDIERTFVLHNCHVPPGSCSLAVGMLPGALLIIELGGLHRVPSAPRCLKTPRISHRSAHVPASFAAFPWRKPAREYGSACVRIGLKHSLRHA